MKNFLFLSIGYFCIVCAKNDTTEKNIEQEIDRLEKEKSDLFIQIHEAINESIVVLSKSNNSDAKEGIKYLKELKSQVDDLNATEVIFDNFTESNDTALVMENGTDYRRYIRKPSGKSEQKIKDAIIQFMQSKVVHGNGDVDEIPTLSKKDRQKQQSRIEVQQKLDEWLLKKELEREKIKEYQQRLDAEFEKNLLDERARRETCPNYGEKSGKKRIGSKHSKKRKDRVYPCCRKCCKKSYLGCL